MKKNRTVYRRIVAYMIDIMVITLISTMFSRIDKINITKDEYSNTYVEYVEYYNYIVDNGLTTDIYSDKLLDINYDLEYLNVPSSIISLIVILLYFVVFQYINNGKTIGKALMKLQIKNVKKNKVSMISLFLRYLILSNVITGIISIVLLCYGSKDTYLNYYSYIEYFEMFIMLIVYGMFMFREDNRGLHDIVGNTMVVSTIKEKNDSIKEANVSKEREIEDEDSNR